MSEIERTLEAVEAAGAERRATLARLRGIVRARRETRGVPLTYAKFIEAMELLKQVPDQPFCKVYLSRLVTETDPLALLPECSQIAPGSPQDEQTKAPDQSPGRGPFADCSPTAAGSRGPPVVGVQDRSGAATGRQVDQTRAGQLH